MTETLKEILRGILKEILKPASKEIPKKTLRGVLKKALTQALRMALLCALRAAPALRMRPASTAPLPRTLQQPMLGSLDEALNEPLKRPWPAPPSSIPRKRKRPLCAGGW